MERFFAVSLMERVDVRGPSETHDNTFTMSGYAAVFNQRTTAFDDGFDKFTIEIAPEAFNNVLANQALGSPEGAVHFNFGHDMNTAVAATDVPDGQPGSLKLTPDSHGLHFLARVSRDDPDGQRLAAKMHAGVVRQASFAFIAKPSEFTRVEKEDGGVEVNRRITEIQSLHDVCACPQGMFSQTVSGLQQYAKLLGQPDLREAISVNPPREAPAQSTPDEGGGAASQPALDMEALRAARDRHRPVRK